MVITFFHHVSCELHWWKWNVSSVAQKNVICSVNKLNMKWIQNLIVQNGRHRKEKSFRTRIQSIRCCVYVCVCVCVPLCAWNFFIRLTNKNLIFKAISSIVGVVQTGIASSFIIHYTNWRITWKTTFNIAFAALISSRNNNFHFVSNFFPLFPVFHFWIRLLKLKNQQTFDRQQTAPTSYQSAYWLSKLRFKIHSFLFFSIFSIVFFRLVTFSFRFHWVFSFANDLNFPFLLIGSLFASYNMYIRVCYNW